MALTSSLLLTITGPAWLVLLAADGEAVAQQGVAAGDHAAADRPAATMLATRVGTPNAALRLGACAGSFAKPGPEGRTRLRLAAVKGWRRSGPGRTGFAATGRTGFAGTGRRAGGRLGGLALAGWESRRTGRFAGPGRRSAGCPRRRAGAAGTPDAARRPRRGPAGGSGSRAPGFRLLSSDVVLSDAGLPGAASGARPACGCSGEPSRTPAGSWFCCVGSGDTPGTGFSVMRLPFVLVCL